MVHIIRKVSSTPAGRRLDSVHRIGAALLGAGLCVFGVLGFVNHLEFLAVRGRCGRWRRAGGESAPGRAVAERRSC